MKRRHSLKTIALLGPDGAGKTSVAQRIVASGLIPIKYLYMGTSIESSNVALPTSRLVHRWKVYRYRQRIRRSGAPVPKTVTLHGLEHRIDQRGKLGAVVRLLTRVAEESYRQFVSWLYQQRGYIVLYDRHFFFDVCPSPSEVRPQRLADRLHCYFLTKLYPRPDLIILLDAPAEVLYARKQEVPLHYLDSNRKQLIEATQNLENAYLVSADKPLEQIVSEVSDLIIRHCSVRVSEEPCLDDCDAHPAAGGLHE